MEDTHYCLKCGATFIGLDNYVNHRKVTCYAAATSKMFNETMAFENLSVGKEDAKIATGDCILDEKSELENKNFSLDLESICNVKKITIINEEVTGKVEADDFFSSLELQSSSKSSTNAVNLNAASKLSAGIITRSKSLLSSYQEISKVPEKVESLTSANKGRGNNVAVVDKTRKVKKPRLRKSRKKIKKVCDAQQKRDTAAKDKKENFTTQGKQNLGTVKAEEDSEVKIPVLDKSRDDDDWTLFNQLIIKKDLEEKLPEPKKGNNESTAPFRRYTPELFSMSPILMTDEMPEDKDVEVNEFLEDEDYDNDDGYLNLEDVDEFSYAPPRSYTGGKWKPGSLSGRASPVLWTSQSWDNLLEERQQEEDDRNSSEALCESLTELSSDRCKSSLAAFTGGKWKSSAPPSTYTGGKWKPYETPQTVKKLNQDVPQVSCTGGKWHPGKRILTDPPTTHMGGKWKPQLNPNVHGKSWKLETALPNLNIPPSSEHTQGKWVPFNNKNSVDNKTLNVIASCQSTSGKCLKTSGGLIQYYCSPCNRRLASKKMYKKHVLSELHLKRVLQENELEFDSRSIKLFRNLFSVINTKQRGLNKRTIKKPEFFKDMEMGVNRRTSRNMKSDGVKKKKLARRELIRCDICKAKLASHQLGKHLVSYYHSRRIQLNDPYQQKLVLDNIHAIVKQAPFQCGLCKFYFNTHKLFKKHWTSEEHKWMEEKEGKKFWCVLCNFECETSRSMELHLDSNSHREVIMAVNKSIPIIIRQKQILNCKLCDKEFRYNFALIRHNRISHGLNESENIKVYPCTNCKYKSKTVKSLQRHILRRHKDIGQVPYFCSACDLYFNSAEDARVHRKSQSHRSRNLPKNSKMLPGISKACPHCPAELDSLAALKNHVSEEHPNLRPKCSKCGKLFAIPQEVAQHKKEKSCTFLQVSSRGSSTIQGYACRQCAYSSCFKADVMHHEMLHEKPPTSHNDGSQKLFCPVCGKSYRVFALKVHLRTHTGERPYKCKLCSKTFIRRSRLMSHLKFEHNVDFEVKLKPPSKKDEHHDVYRADDGKQKSTKMEIKFCEGPKCGDSKCKYTAKDAEDLEHHTRVHIGRKLFQCPLCNYQAKTNTLLKRHNKIHSDERSYPCPHCPFRGRLASHLKRHLRVHTGAKPYKCPHCSYQCNILENLRKHVLFTKIHPGKKLYECKICDFSTNVSNAFKRHLLEMHSDKFGTEIAATAYIAGIYNMEEDVQTAVNSVPVKQKASRPQQKANRTTVLKNIAILTKKFEPIAPKLPPAEQKKAVPNPSQGGEKSLGNSLLDKRKVLEMELRKLKNQVRNKSEAPIKSYPAPAILKAERDQKGKSDGSKDAKSERDGGFRAENFPKDPKRQKWSLAGAGKEPLPHPDEKVAIISVPPFAEHAPCPEPGGAPESMSAGNAAHRVETAAEEPSPTYILFESGISFEENEDHLAEQEFYLLENYND